MDSFFLVYSQIIRDKQIQLLTGKQTIRQTNRWTEKQNDGKTDGQRGIWTDGEITRQKKKKGGQINRRTDG